MDNADVVNAIIALTTVTPTDRPEVPILASAPLPPAKAAPQGDERPGSLGACVEWVRTEMPCAPKQLVAMRTAVSTLARTTRIAVDQMPAAPALLRPIFSNILPAAHKISRKRWLNLRSDIASMLIHCGWVAPETRPKLPVSAEWEPILLAARREADMDPKDAPLQPFARYCMSAGIAPRDVNLTVVADFQQWRVDRTLDLHPRNSVVGLQRAWNHTATAVPALGLTPFKLPSMVQQKARTVTAFPESFQKDLADHLQSLQLHDPLNETGAPKLAPLTIEHRRRALLRAATYFENTGQPLAQITGLATIVTPKAVWAILMQLYEEAGKRWTDVAVGIVTHLVAVARHWVRMPDENIMQLQAYKKRVKPERKGLSRKVRDRLAQFESDEAKRDFFELPGRAFEMADSMLKDGSGLSAAKLDQAALALAILQTQPLRLGNLAAINMVDHFGRNRKGVLQRISLPASMVKNRVDIVINVPPALAQRIERHIVAFRPFVKGHDISSCLFPAVAKDHLDPSSLGRIMRRLVERQLGAEFNAHLARHLAVDMLLDADPHNLVVAQRLLGHSTPQTTAGMYGISRTGAAQKTYASLIEQVGAEVTQRRAQKKRRKPTKPRKPAIREMGKFT